MTGEWFAESGTYLRVSLALFEAGTVTPDLSFGRGLLSLCERETSTISLLLI